MIQQTFKKLGCEKWKHKISINVGIDFFIMNKACAPCNISFAFIIHYCHTSALTLHNYVNPDKL